MRVCGDCVACCVYLKIDHQDLQKKAMEHCQHLITIRPVQENIAYYVGKHDNGNCLIYKDRPDVCQSYKCLWLMGYGEEKDRPDRSGILCDTIHNIEGAIECKSLWDGASNTLRGKMTIQRLVDQTRKVGLVPNFYERKLKKVVAPI
jgi:Fe-S-cluster containining protein